MFRLIKARGDYLPGRDTPLWGPVPNVVLGTLPAPPFPEGVGIAYFALGCFWGAEKLFWEVPGVYSTAVGYCGGVTPNPTYEEVCTDLTGHAETVLVAYHEDRCDYRTLLKVFWEGHDPTTPNRQGNDVGTQYRSAIFCTTEEQLKEAIASKEAYERELAEKGFRPVVTEITMAGPFYYAEEYHQQYLAKHPNGYCGLRPTGVALPSNLDL